MDSQSILDREFLEIRAKILEVAASLDRLNRAEGDVSNDSRMEQIKAAIEIVSSQDNSANRAEQIQMLFSRSYQQDWQDRFELKARS